MKKITFLFCVIVTTLFSWPGNTFFSDESRQIILNGEYNFSNSWSGTVWSSCWARRYGKLELKAEHLIVPVESEAFESGNYLLNLYVNRGDFGQKKPAPITFIINGIFGEPESGLVKQVGQQLIERGHHIIALGNPLGTWGLKQKPLYTIANFVQESEAYLSIMDEAKKWYEKRGLFSGEVNIVGISYGGFVAGIIKSLDSRRGRPLINGMATLLSPPLEMGPALRNMDHVLFETASLGKLPDWALAIVSLRFCLLPPRRFIDPVQLKWAKAIFGFYGFQRSLADSTILISDLYGIGDIPTGRRERKLWRRTFTFSHYIEEYASDLGELMDSDEGRLYYWLDQIPASEYRIFASSDDPLNEEVPWRLQENTFLVDYGGHYGLRAFKYFDEFLYSIF